jgi:hypothetical protein
MSRSYAVHRCGCWLTSLFIRCCVNANPFCISTERHRAGKMLLICRSENDRHRPYHALAVECSSRKLVGTPRLSNH